MQNFWLLVWLLPIRYIREKYVFLATQKVNYSFWVQYKPSNYHHQVQDIYQVINSLMDREVWFQWLCKHYWVRGNEKADNIAKMATNMNPVPLGKLPLSDGLAMCQAIKRQIDRTIKQVVIISILFLNSPKIVSVFTNLYTPFHFNFCFKSKNRTYSRPVLSVPFWGCSITFVIGLSRTRENPSTYFYPVFKIN